ncbi:RNase H family protein [Filifactor alocis]|uniref:RNase H family protein n=1 Tax=Filifactor alocis TaxID=143361 RepID=UPI003F9ED87F
MKITELYIVNNNKIVGVLTVLDTNDSQVKILQDAEYQLFHDEKSALNYIASSDSKKVNIYVDGSFNNTTGEIGSGVVVVENDKIIQTISKKYNNKQWSTMQNVAGELFACIEGVNYTKNSGYKDITIYYDYQGIEAWTNGEWKAKKEETQRYKAWFDEISKEIKINFVKVKAHSGNKYNELADKLANVNK